ncbi:MAG: transglycosylase domain-containing protein [Alphaproteobacteria bacterium]|nr:transglycosylase domain-containing protein [Alphaproteobacteria bacterium]
MSIFAAMAGVAAWHEMETSQLQARFFSRYDRGISFQMQPDVNPLMRFPKYGPYNARLGYSYMPFFIKAIQADDFTVAAQMRASPAYTKLLRDGFYPVYRPKTVAGLTLYDRHGEQIYAASYPRHVFASFGQVPPLLTHTLLYIENRDLLEPGPVTRNPVIEWGRFAHAAFGFIARHFVPGFNDGGGSTLATQTEKFRFSPGGATDGGIEKLRQIISASFRVYLDGPDTRAAREKILLDYLNSTPLSARPGFGEINSIGDGLWAWFGYDLPDVTAALNGSESTPDGLARKAQMYRAALGLVLAQRRPSYYLQTNRGALDDLIDATLDRLQNAGVISVALRDATKRATLVFLPHAPEFPEPPYIEEKAVDAFRTRLLGLLGLRRLYEVDRLDLSAQTTIDQSAQRKLVDFLKQVDDKDFMQAHGFYGFRLLSPDNDLSKIKWSVVLYERGANSDKLRLQADNIDGPFDMNDGVKLDLGSTAKLRTMATYLEIITELHRRYAGLSKDDLQDLADDAPDVLTKWAIGWLIDHPDADLPSMLDASLDRQYSGNNDEVFFTGGGEHVFHNFEASENNEVMDLHEAFRRSVNLVFVRLMRDIVNYTIAQDAAPKDEILDDPDEPARRAYLERFADQEGQEFLGRYIADYKGLDADQRMQKMLAHAHKGATARAVLFRSVFPDATFDAFAQFMAAYPPRDPPDAARLARLYRDNAPGHYDLSDRAYLTGMNPMELWLVAYMQAHPDASRREMMDVSYPVRIQSYAWLFKPRMLRAQDTRIRIMLEEDAFAHIQKRWARLGYPFDYLVPSYATAIGSSADRPGALAQLVGIILADGRKLPVERFESITFAADTPYQTLLKHDDTAPAEQVMNPAVARELRGLMREVVDEPRSTATRVAGAYHDADGNVIPVGGKTGTGDQRFDEFGAGGRIINSRVVNRTGTFVFYIGDRFFGVVTAHVAGEDAAQYHYSSALAVQMLRQLAPIINPMINEDAPPAPQAASDLSPPVPVSQPLPP